MPWKRTVSQTAISIRLRSGQVTTPRKCQFVVTGLSQPQDSLSKTIAMMIKILALLPEICKTKAAFLSKIKMWPGIVVSKNFCSTELTLIGKSNLSFLHTHLWITGQQVFPMDSQIARTVLVHSVAAALSPWSSQKLTTPTFVDTPARSTDNGRRVYTQEFIVISVLSKLCEIGRVFLQRQTL